MALILLKKIQNHERIHPHDMPMIQHYPKGIPCRSALLPVKIAEIDVIKNRYSENQVGTCYKTCPSVPAITEIKDQDGNVVETVETGKGMVSMRDGPPKLPDLPKRKVLYKTRKSKLAISCPQ